MEHTVLNSNQEWIAEWRGKCKHNHCNMPWGYEQCSPNAFYTYWLSLMNCAITVIKNNICLMFCSSQFFTNWSKGNKIISGIQSKDLPSTCFKQAKAFFDSKKNDAQLRVQDILHDYAFFQHFNHVLRKLDKNRRTCVLFPTLAFDWTWDFSVAEKFAGRDGNVVSISFEAYKRWNPPRAVKFQSSEQDILVRKMILPGFETYEDAPFWGGSEHDCSWDNNLMTEQKGAVIFWPWEYTIDDLLSNDFGKMLDFRLEGLCR